MPLVRRLSARFQSAALLTLMATTAMCQSNAPVDPALPFPEQYRLSDASVHITRKPNPRSTTAHDLLLTGQGKLVLKDLQKHRQLAYPEADFVQVLENLYRIRFLELPTNLMARHGVGVDAQGIVYMRVAKQADAAWTRVCLSAGEARRCVTFADDYPGELGKLVDQWSADAQRRALTAGK